MLKILLKKVMSQPKPSHTPQPRPHAPPARPARTPRPHAGEAVLEADEANLLYKNQIRIKFGKFYASNIF